MEPSPNIGEAVAYTPTVKSINLYGKGLRDVLRT